MRWLGVLGTIALLLVGTLPAAAATITVHSAYGTRTNETDCTRTSIDVPVWKRVSGGALVASELDAQIYRYNACRDHFVFVYKAKRPLNAADTFHVNTERSRARLVANVEWRAQDGTVVPGRIDLTWVANDSKPFCGEPSPTQRMADMTGTATVADRTFRFTLPDPSCSFLDRYTFEFDE